MFEFTQFRVAVRRQHFAVGIDVNAGAFGLLQQVMQIQQIVTGNQDTFAGNRFDVDLSRRRVAVFTGFASVQNTHNFKVHLADTHGALQQRVHVGRPGAKPRHILVVLGVNLVVVLTQYVGVFHISCRAFQAVQAQ